MKLFVFGSTGDLVKRKVLPALQALSRDDLEICALGRRDIAHEDYKDYVCGEGGCSLDFRDKIKYHKINFESEDICEDGCSNLFSRDEVNYVYVSLPPHLIEKVLYSVVKMRGLGFKMKILIEKPFGNNSEVALRLKNIVLDNGLLDDVFLSDHYLFKRFEYDGEFEHMRIVSTESVGLEGRVGYYDSVGALRDMIQSHFMNIVLSKIDSHEDEFSDFEVLDFKRGQYSGYVDELGVESFTETFVYLKFKTKSKVFEFVTGKALGSKEFYLEIDGKRVEVDSSGDYENLFDKFFGHEQMAFAEIDKSIFSWELIDKLDGHGSGVFYYDKNSVLSEILSWD